MPPERARAIAMLAALVIGGCGGAIDPDAGMPIDAGVDAGPPEPFAVSLRIDPTTHLHPMGRIGWNLGRGTLYGPEGDPLHPEWRSAARVAAVAALREVRAASGGRPLVRWSGLQVDGALGGDGYHFERFVAPGHTPAADDNVAPFEYRAVMDEIDADRAVTLNFGSGSADEAARYVTHLNGADPGDPQVIARRAWPGGELPWDQRLFEIGNESYGPWNTGFSATSEHGYANPAAPGGGDPAWHGRPSSSAADYAARALAYVDAVRAVTPDAEFWVPLSQAPMDAWGGLERALADLAPLLSHEAVTGVVVHHYQADDAATLGHRDRNDPAMLLAGAEMFAPRYADLRARLGAIDRPPGASPLAIAVTEYHLAGAFARGMFRRGDQAIVGLGIADLMLMYARLGTEELLQHLALALDGEEDRLIEPWYVPFRWRDGALAPMPSYVVTRMIAEHLEHDVVAIDAIESPTAPTILAGASVEVPRVHAAAFASESGDRVTLVLLQRDLARPAALRVEVPAGYVVASATIYAPPSYDHDAAAAPIATRAIEPRDAGAGAITLDLPPASVLALRWSR